MSVSTRISLSLTGLITVAVLAFTPPATALACEECPEGGECVWNSCYPEGEDCWECEYVCEDMTCYYNTCSESMEVCHTA